MKKLKQKTEAQKDVEEFRLSDCLRQKENIWKMDCLEVDELSP